MKNYETINNCRICKSKKIVEVIDLKSQFIQGSFIKKGYPRPYLKRIPLMLVLCKNCLLVQTLYTVNKKTLYKNYWYSSGINNTMRTHLSKLVLDAHKFFKKSNNINVLDIGCNDGTLLNFYPRNVRCFGIDPSQIIKKIKNKKIHKINDFFPPKKKPLPNFKSKFSIITSIAMFYDINDPNSFVRKIAYSLKKNGIWIFELSYLIDMLRLNSFDTICHEHLEYYSIQTLNFLMKKNNLKIFKISRNNINGGSIRCFVTHLDNNKFDNKKNYLNISKLISMEKKLKINNLKIYKKFSKNIKNIKKNLRNLLYSLKKQGKTIQILGASTKGNTILQFLEIEKNIINFAVERNKQKIGAKIIGSNIKIISEKKSFLQKPDYYLVLPWHFKSEIVKRENKFLKSGGTLIFPLPKVQLVNNSVREK